jgi:membrane-bound lytic murein transglycosylase D
MIRPINWAFCIIKILKMNTKRLLLLSIGLCIFSLLSAKDGLKRKNAKSHPQKVTTQAYNSLKDSTISANNGFKDLFSGNFMVGTSGARLNPKALIFVQDYMDKNTKDLQTMKTWGKPYFNMIDGILSKYGLPGELKYLAVIESELKPTARSWAGAVGPWQLMPGTARQLGLKVSRRSDERKNYYKSTVAAAKYLRDLYTEFGDWLLVIAAYNGGTGNVYNAIKRSGSQNFWTLQNYLPAESRKHVKKFIATHYIFEGQGGVTTLTKEEATLQLSGSAMYVFHRNLSKKEVNESKTIAISGKYHSNVIAKYVVMEIDEFNRYNPDFDKIMAGTNNTYDLRLPTDKMELFASNKYQILSESVQVLLDGIPTKDENAPDKSLDAIAKTIPSK